MSDYINIQFGYGILFYNEFHLLPQVFFNINPCLGRFKFYMNEAATNVTAINGIFIYKCKAAVVACI